MKIYYCNLGGSWLDDRGFARAGGHFRLTPNVRYGDIGLRLVRNT